MSLEDKLKKIMLQKMFEQQAVNADTKRTLLEVFGLEDNMDESSDGAMKRSLIFRIKSCKSQLMCIPEENFQDFLSRIEKIVHTTIDDCYCPHCICKGISLLTKEDIEEIGVDLTRRAIQFIKQDLLARNKMHLDMTDGALKLTECIIQEEEEHKNTDKAPNRDNTVKENSKKDDSDKNVLKEKKARSASYDRTLYTSMTKEELIDELIKSKEDKD